MAVTSLDLKERNRNRFCGSWTLTGPVIRGQREVRAFQSLKCKAWSCGVCGPKKAGRLRSAIIREAVANKLQRLMTLTLDPSRGPASDSIPRIKDCWNKMRVYLKRKYGRPFSFIAVLELQKSGYAHFHVLIDSYIDQRWLSRAWDSLGGGRVVDIRFVDIHRVAGYVSKYLSKDMFLGLPRGTRRYATSRNVRLLNKVAAAGWRMMRFHISTVAAAFKQRLANIRMNPEGEIEFFEINFGIN